MYVTPYATLPTHVLTCVHHPVAHISGLPIHDAPLPSPPVPSPSHLRAAGGDRADPAAFVLLRPAAPGRENQTGRQADTEHLPSLVRTPVTLPLPPFNCLSLLSSSPPLARARVCAHLLPFLVPSQAANPIGGPSCAGGDQVELRPRARKPGLAKRRCLGSLH